MAQQLLGPHLVALGRHEGEIVGVFLGQGPEAEVTHRGLLAGRGAGANGSARHPQARTCSNLRQFGGPGRRAREIRRSTMAAFLAGKVVAVTGGGGGIGRAVRWLRRTRGPRSWWPTTAWAWPGRIHQRGGGAVVAEITEAGGEAVAVADDISTMESGEPDRTAVEKWGRIDGVVAVAGILRERMLFNMSEDEWDAVIATHLKGHFTVFRAAAAVMRKQEGGGPPSGSRRAPTPAAWPRRTTRPPRGASSRWCARPPLACTATASRPTPSRRSPGRACRPTCRRAGRDGRPRGRRAHGRLPAERPGQARHRPGLHRGGPEDRRGNQPAEVRAMWADGRWTPEQIAARLDATSAGADGLLDRLEEMRQAAASGEKPNA